MIEYRSSSIPIFYIVNDHVLCYFITLSTPNKGEKESFNSLKQESFGVGSVFKRCTNLDIASDLMTCILPMILKSLQDHESKSFLTSSSFIL